MVTPDQERRLITSACREFVNNQIVPIVHEWRHRPWQDNREEMSLDRIARAAHGLGLYSVGVPASDGGTELDAQTMSECIQELARGEAGFSRLLAQDWALVGLISQTATPGVRKEWLSTYMDAPGPTFTCDPDDIRTAVGGISATLPVPRGLSESMPRARLQGGQLVLTGSVSLPAPSSASLLVMAIDVTDIPFTADPYALVVVPATSEGVLLSDQDAQIGQNVVTRQTVRLDAVHVSTDHLLDRNALVDAAKHFARISALLCAAGAVGVAQAAFDAAARQVQERIQGGKLIIHHQAVALRAASMATRLELIRSVTVRAARALDAGSSDADSLLLIAKLAAAEGSYDNALDCIYVFGGSGVMGEVGVEKHLRDAAIYLAGEGTCDLDRMCIASQIFQLKFGTYYDSSNWLDLIA